MGVFLDSPYTGLTFSPATPIDIATIEAAIVTQLQTYLAAALGPQMIEVVHFPDKPESYELRHRIGVAMVIYMGGEYAVIEDIGHVVQERTLEFEVGLRIRDLGWAFGGPPSGTSPGAYQILEFTRAALLGFQPNTGCTPMKALREDFVARDKQGGVWVYAIRFSTRTLAVEDFQPPNFPLFIKGIAQEEKGITTTSLGFALMTFSGTPNTITLANGNISAVVISNQALTTTYALNTDYSLDTIDGIITRIITGAIPTNATVAVSYAYSDQVIAQPGDTGF